MIGADSADVLLLGTNFESNVPLRAAVAVAPARISIGPVGETALTEVFRLRIPATVETDSWTLVVIPCTTVGVKVGVGVGVRVTVAVAVAVEVAVAVGVAVDVDVGVAVKVAVGV